MESAKKIVILHGWGASTEKLQPLAKELISLGWKVFLPRLPGFGTVPPKEVWGVNEYSDYIYRKAIKTFGKSRFYVFGHSFGGRLAIKMASEQKEYLKGVILCSTSGISRGNFLKRALFLILAKIGKIFLLVPEVASFWRKVLYKLAREHDYEKSQGHMREIFKKIISEDLKPLLARIKIPALVLWGRDDRMTPVSDAYFIKNSVPDSHLILFNAGHRLPYDKPKEVALEIDRWTVQQT